MLQLKKTDVAVVECPICFPEDGSVMRGTVKAHFRYVSQDRLDELSRKVADGEITAQEQFQQLVPMIEGIPGEDGSPLTDPADVHDWLAKHNYGAVLRAGVFRAFLESYTEGKALGKNSKTSRGR